MEPKQFDYILAHLCTKFPVFAPFPDLKKQKRRGKGSIENMENRLNKLMEKEPEEQEIYITDPKQNDFNEN